MKKLLIAFALIVGFSFMAQAADHVKPLTDGPRVQLVDQAKRTFVIDFTASWCGPCRMFAPTFHAVANEMKGEVDFYQVDVDNNPSLCQLYRVSAVPTIVIYNPKTKQQKVIQGVVSKQDFVTEINKIK